MTTALSRSRQKSPLDELVPDGLGDLSDEQTAIPRIARDPALTATIAGAVERVPTAHRLLLGDSRDLSKLESGSVHLVLTSPPYWTLKEYREASGQLGAVADYERFVAELDRVWRECFRLLAPGGRLVCVVGDVLLSRRRNNGRHVGGPAARLDSDALPDPRLRQPCAHHLAQDRERRLRGWGVAASSGNHTNRTPLSRMTSSTYSFSASPAGTAVPRSRCGYCRSFRGTITEGGSGRCGPT